MKASDRDEIGLCLLSLILGNVLGENSMFSASHWLGFICSGFPSHHVPSLCGRGLPRMKAITKYRHRTELEPVANKSAHCLYPENKSITLSAYMTIQFELTFISISSANMLKVTKHSDPQSCCQQLWGLLVLTGWLSWIASILIKALPVWQTPWVFLSSSQYHIYFHWILNGPPSKANFGSHAVAPSGLSCLPQSSKTLFTTWTVHCWIRVIWLVRDFNSESGKGFNHFIKI